jgi:NAD(P)H-flavin reductase
MLESSMAHAPALPPAPAPRAFGAALVTESPLTPRVHSLVISAPGLDWIPGQYLEVAPKDGERQPYSIASAPDPARPGVFELAVSTSDGTLSQLKPGAQLDVRGPLGQFFTIANTSPKLYVGMGTGLAPLRAMLLDSLRTRSSVPHFVLHGARTEEDVLWRSEWEGLVRQDSRVSFAATLSRGSAAWSGRRGRVQAHLGEILSSLADPEVFVCGTALAVRDCRRVLADELGVPLERIFVEGH